MGVNLKPFISARKIEISDLSGKIIAIDAFNAIHQFIAIIRQIDGTSLKDRKGNITSHLSGIFYRTANFVEYGIKPVYVFDGEPHPLKLRVLKKRKEIRETAREEWEEALKEGDIEEALKKAKRSGTINEKIINQSKELLHYLGIPYIEAKGEGEGQAAYMNMRGDVYGVASQDYDSILFGAKMLIRNLAITGRRKLSNKRIYVDVYPEEILSERIFEDNGITREQIVDIAILIGTDFNEGVEGIGPKKALKLIKEHGCIENLIEKNILNIEGYEEVRKIFLEPDINPDYNLEWSEIDEKATISFMCDEHDFNKERVINAIEKYKNFAKKLKQKNLFDF
ncbi:MAG: flap endonuclease-1 [Thermoplasmatales archaeon]|nr:flap endonuclease-1 [Thermoplasmatales archaeon]